MAGKQIPHEDFVSKGLPKKGEDQIQDDQIGTDIQKVKEVKDQLWGRVSSSVNPVISKQGKKIEGITASVQGLANEDLLKKLLRVVIIALLFIALLYIGSLIFKTATQNGENGQVVIPAPSVAPFNPFNPSIYAEDEGVLQFEEDLKILDRELSTSQLKEIILTPPFLNFDIDFEE